MRTLILAIALMGAVATAAVAQSGCRYVQCYTGAGVTTCTCY